MESLQEIMMDAYREGKEDSVKEALSRRVEVKKSGKGSREELHNAKYGTVEGEAAAALKMAKNKGRKPSEDFVGSEGAPEEPKSMPEAFSVFRAMKDLLMKKNQAYHY